MKKNQSIIQSILFIETLEEFLDFSKENALDAEFFHTQRMEYQEISEIICKEKIYTDCSDYDNFKKSLIAINKVLDIYGVQLIVLEDFVYCDCEYTILKLDKTLADKVLSSWSSDNFEFSLEVFLGIQ